MEIVGEGLASPAHRGVSWRESCVIRGERVVRKAAFDNFRAKVQGRKTQSTELSREQVGGRYGLL